jgi:hypothetical protein
MISKIKGYPKVSHLFAIQVEGSFEKVRKEIQGVWNVVKVQNFYVFSLKKDSSVCFEVDSVTDLVFALEAYMGHAWMIKHKLMEVKK